jgi:hypothetical protein
VTISAPTTASMNVIQYLLHSSLVWLILLTIATAVVYASSLIYPFFWVNPIDIDLARGSNQTRSKMQSH